jgi:hypothetical protein
MRRIAIAVAVVVAVFVFVVTWRLWTDFFMSDACLDAGGAWDSAMDVCRGVDGFEDRRWPVWVWVLLIGIPAGLATVVAAGVYFLLSQVQWRNGVGHG